MNSGYLGDKTPKLGFGLMRLPMIGDEIDMEQVKSMVDKFMEKGFTYFDTAYVYINGKSEVAAREAIVKRYPRDSFTLATKLPLWDEVETEADMQKIFDESMARAGVEYFDYYLLHAMDKAKFEKADRIGAWDFIFKMKAQGKIRHCGFSFHDSAEVLDEALTKHPEAEFVQLQINYADWENPAVQSRGCYEVARKHGKPVIIMEPVKGGMLATPPQPVLDILKGAEPEASAASWAIRFAASLDGVITVLSGMSNVEQMKDNLSFMKDFNGLSEKERETLDQAQKALAEIPLIPCTNCNYCAKVCPENIGISGSFTAMNYLTLYGDMGAAKHQENWLVGGHGKKQANQCIKCGRCEKACPQHIAIRRELEKVSSELLG